jgi:heme A synthase
MDLEGSSQNQTSILLSIDSAKIRRNCPSKVRRLLAPRHSQPRLRHRRRRRSNPTHRIRVLHPPNCIPNIHSLSITEWKPVTGVIPPLSYESWTDEFEKYKATPEYQILNPRMDLDDFKSIYYMEYTHRMLGRAIGLVFVVPATYFILRGRVSLRFAVGLVGIGGLIGFQGFLGWWMVKSGLKAEELHAQDGVPRVSQYRLAAHLGTAFGVYSILVLMGLGVLNANKLLRMDVVARARWVESLSTVSVRKFRGKVVGLSHIIFLTVLSGWFTLFWLLIKGHWLLDLTQD